MKTITEPARRIPTAHECDICVVGGSCTGVFAAVRAARLGAKVAIIEKHNCFGGVATCGLVNIWHSLHDTTGKEQIIAGLTQEVVERLQRRNGVTITDDRVNHHRLNTEELKIELDELITEHRIHPFLHTFYAAPHLEGDRLAAIIVENKSGRRAIAARMFIDATGDADLCLDLGLESYRPETLQPPTTCAKLFGVNALENFNWRQAVVEHGSEFGLREDWGWSSAIPGMPGLEMHADTHVFETDTADGDLLTASEIEGRRQVRAIMDVIRKYGPKEQQIALADLAASIGARETRRITGRYRLTGDDVLYGERFEDAIANGSYRVDIHHADSPGITFRYLDGTEVVVPSRIEPKKVSRWRDPLPEDPTFYQIPFRSLLPASGCPNLIMAGRMLDADKVAFSAARVMVNMNQTGEAAGVAAYLSLEGDCPTAEADVTKLRKKLSEGGSIIL